jgi:HPt (histidine-containing phosphotransfer) domain-containing protein
MARLLRGAAGNVGGEALSAIAYEIEKVAFAGDLSAVSVRIVELNHKFMQLKQAMTEDRHDETR